MSYCVQKKQNKTKKTSSKVIKTHLLMTIRRESEWEWHLVEHIEWNFVRERKREKENEYHLTVGKKKNSKQIALFWSLYFNGIPTLMGYLMPNSFL